MLEPETRLRQSIIDGNLLVVKRLLKRFPDLLENIDSSNGWSSLHYAAYYGRYLVCVHLISLGHDKQEISKTFKGNACVHLSLSNGHEQTTHLLLQHFPNQLDMKGEEGHTPLHVSTIKDYFKCIEMLLGMGADINSVDDEGNNCLHLAMKYNSLKSLKILVKAQIDSNCKNNAGLKPVDVASSFQTVSFYESVLQDPLTNTMDDFATPTLSGASSGTFEEYSGFSTALSKRRTLSASLPPLPSVSTTRRPSTSSTATRSPIPRSAISLEFSGSNTNSFIYSPTQSKNHHQQQQQPQKVALAGLSIKPPTLGMTKSSSPILYSPTNPALYTTIREEQRQSTDPNASMSTSNSTTGVSRLASFPSMSSLNSFGRKTPTEGRTRASSLLNATPQSINFVSVNKTRSNSGGEPRRSVSYAEETTNTPPQQQMPQRKPPPPLNAILPLSRTSTSTSTATVSTGSEDNSNSSPNFKTHSNTSLSSVKELVALDNDNESLRSRLSSKFDSYKNRTMSLSSATSGGSTSGKSSRRNSILNIHISSLGRRKEDK